MRELYNEFFRVSKHEKIREKVMLTRFSMTIISIIICLAAISFSAYAYFSHDAFSGSSSINFARFETDVSVQINDINGEAVEVRTSNRINHAATLTGGKTYFITLKHTERSTVQTGFVTITATGCDISEYHTQQIGKNEDGTTKTVTFTLNPSADTEVVFNSCWGTSSKYPTFKDIKDDTDLYIQDGENINLSITNPSAQTTPPVSDETENTEPPSTEEQDISNTASQSIAIQETEPENQEKPDEADA